MVACLGLLRRDPVTSPTALLAESVLPYSLWSYHTAKLQDYAKKKSCILTDHAQKGLDSSYAFRAELQTCLCEWLSYKSIWLK